MVAMTDDWENVVAEAGLHKMWHLWRRRETTRRSVLVIRRRINATFGSSQILESISTPNRCLHDFRQQIKYFDEALFENIFGRLKLSTLIPFAHTTNHPMGNVLKDKDKKRRAKSLQRIWMKSLTATSEYFGITYLFILLPLFFILHKASLS